jgi:hypothetical protein
MSSDKIATKLVSTVRISVTFLANLNGVSGGAAYLSVM